MFFRRSPHPTQAELSAYLDGELAPARGRDMRDHLETCTSCRESLAALEETRVLLSALPRVQPPRSFRLSPSMAGRRSEPSRPRVLSFAPALTLSLLVALLLVDLAGNAGVNTASDESAGLAASKATGGAASDTVGSTQTLQAGPSPASAAARESAPAPNAASAAPPAVAPAPAAAPPLAPGQSGATSPQPPAVAGQSAAPVSPRGADATAPSSQAGLAPASPQPNVLVPEPAVIEAPQPGRGEGGGVSLLRALEVMALAAFIASLVALALPRLIHKGESP